jgi:hypothetical protein
MTRGTAAQLKAVAAHETGSAKDRKESAGAGPTLVGIEPTMTFNQIMVEYGWKYHKVYRYYINHPRTGVKFTYNPRTRPKRFYDVPVSVVLAEWEMMHSVNEQKADEWARLHPYQRRKR